MGFFLDDLISDSKKAFKRRMSMSSISMPIRKKLPPRLEISSPVLTHATGVYSKTSPDRSSLLIDLPSPASFSKGQDDFVQNSSTSGQCGFVQDTSTSLVPRIPRHSCPDITVYHNDCDVVTKDKVYRDMKMREFESLIDNSKIIKMSLTPDCASP